ncbi:MAG: ASCH domain-containing protein [Defluviitaleaceae bacterium]|nr:ASCH domain-containing protein [Defluviitaleaceae bacterium]
MDKKAQQYWDDFWGEKEQLRLVDAWQFGVDPDGLAQMVIDGEKTTTSSAHARYIAKNWPLPVVGSYSVILNSQDEPVAIIKVIDVKIMPMNEVSAEHMRDEGDCGLDGEDWWPIHEKFFTELLAEIGMVFSEDILVICERFELVHAKGRHIDHGKAKAGGLRH